MLTDNDHPARSRSPLELVSIACSLLILLALTGCAGEHAADHASPVDTASTETASPEITCNNDVLAGFDGLLVIAPHPDDEVLGFSGLINAYLEQGKPVEVIVSTDGDAYCDACSVWKNGSINGATCSALDFSNFATAEIDSFAEVRRSESTAAMATLGMEPPTFLGYPDTGLAAAWANLQSEELDKSLRRSDFSSCESCGVCGAGYGGGPETELTATTLIETLSARLAATSDNTLVATTHPLDGHGDHASLGNFVKQLNSKLESPRTIALTVIHANTAKGTAYPDCWYPGPAAEICPCADEERATADPTWIAGLRAQRFHPDWPAALPDDADYGEELQLCLPEKLYQGPTATKLAAVESYASQLGFAARSGEMPPAIAGIMDCSGYLISFVRRTEAFALVLPEAAAS